MQIRLYQIILLIFISNFIFCQSADTTITQLPELSQIDRIRISEAFLISEEIGNSVWENWNEAPFAILLVTNDYEYLIRHPKPTEDFIFINYDSLLVSNIYYRPRQFQVNLLATFPAVSGIPTVVIGQAENTSANTSTRWTMTLLHEHFHQLQNSQSDYYSSVNELDLSRGDKTGMWMLNYEFPYDSVEVIDHFSNLCTKLNETLDAIGKDDFKTNFNNYLKLRMEFRDKLLLDDYKYFSFQLWQEGIARYTEYELAKYAGNNYSPTKEFLNLEDYTSFGADADTSYKNLMRVLPKIKLDKFRRVAFYYIGSAEAILLDYINPDWKQKYFTEKFYLENYIVNK